MNTIKDYCRMEVPNWTLCPQDIIDLACDQYFTLGFFNLEHGLQVLACVRKTPAQEWVIHVSISLMTSLRPDLSIEELIEIRDSKVGETLDAFFGKMDWLEGEPTGNRARHFICSLNNTTNN